MAEVRGTVPIARCGHSAVLVNQSAILVYGGLDEDLEVEANIFTFDLGSLKLFLFALFFFSQRSNQH